MLNGEREILAMIMGQGMRLLLIGLIIGVVLALALGRASRTFLFAFCGRAVLGHCRAG